jgi:TolB protein
VYIEGFGTAAEIVVVDANGANRRQLTSNGYYDGEPDWSPDGTRIAFDSSPTDNRDIYTMNGSGGDVRRITTDPMAERHPDWSLDGSLIVYEGGPEVSSDIFVISADGSNPQQLTYTDSGDRAPQFSPNGTQIAFMTDRRGKWEIAIMEYPSGDVVQIYDCPAADCRFPTWSPNGARLVFNTLDGSGNVAEIWVLDVASGASSAVITGQDKGRPAYSRDGQFLFFNATTEGNVDLFRLNLSTTLVERLTISATNEYAPDWGP